MSAFAIGFALKESRLNYIQLTTIGLSLLVSLNAIAMDSNQVSGELKKRIDKTLSAKIVQVEMRRAPEAIVSEVLSILNNNTDLANLRYDFMSKSANGIPHADVEGHFVAEKPSTDQCRIYIQITDHKELVLRNLTRIHQNFKISLSLPLHSGPGCSVPGIESQVELGPLTHHYVSEFQVTGKHPKLEVHKQLRIAFNRATATLFYKGASIDEDGELDWPSDWSFQNTHVKTLEKLGSENCHRIEKLKVTRDVYHPHMDSKPLDSEMVVAFPRNDLSECVGKPHQVRSIVFAQEFFEQD